MLKYRIEGTLSAMWRRFCLVQVVRQSTRRPFRGPRRHSSPPRRCQEGQNGKTSPRDYQWKESCVNLLYRDDRFDHYTEAEPLKSYLCAVSKVGEQCALACETPTRLARPDPIGLQAATISHGCTCLHATASSYHSARHCRAEFR